MTRDPNRRWAEVRRLRAARPRDRFLRASLWVLGLGTAAVWLSGALRPGDLFTERRLANLRRFLSEEVVPAPVREGGWSVEALRAFGDSLLGGRGPGALLEATLQTLALGTAAIVLAGALGSLLAALGARTLAGADPYLADRAPAPWRRTLAVAARAGCVALRAVPEYVLAFLLLGLLGLGPWPAVLALALHNGGILGRLGAETLENLDAAPLRALRQSGASRRQLVGLAAAPLAFGRGLLYLFYRFETAVREATVLGLLGVVSLGYWIEEARARLRYDELLVLVACGAALVLLSEALSVLARRVVRRA